MTITYEDCQKMCKAIMAVRGQPPYCYKSPDAAGETDETLNAGLAETQIIEDFVTHWKDKL